MLRAFHLEVAAGAGIATTNPRHFLLIRKHLTSGELATTTRLEALLHKWNDTHCNSAPVEPVGVMTTPLAGLPFGRPLTVDDLERMPDDGHRYELLHGTLLVSPAPNVWHQAVEVYSPSSKRFDRLSKLSAYEEAGVASYWLIDPDPDEPTLTAPLPGRRPLRRGRPAHRWTALDGQQAVSSRAVPGRPRSRPATGLG